MSGSLLTHKLLVAAFLIVLALPVGPATANNEIAATFTVTSTSDSEDADIGDGACHTAEGLCTLRAAIEQANSNPGNDLITFNIPGDRPHTIRPQSALPVILDGTIIDGYTQPGSRPDTDHDNLTSDPVIAIELDGSLAGASSNGLTIDGPDELYASLKADVRGLAVNRFSNAGIELRDASGLLEGNYVGTDISGSIDLGNGGSGIVHVRSNAVIRNNLVSGNEAFGLYAERVNDVPGGGNLIGTNARGDSALGNTAGGVLLVRVGDFPLHENLISGNSGPGITLVDSGEVYISRNLIGTQVDGRGPLGNAEAGIAIAGSSRDVNIGTSGPNTIAYNEGDGIAIAATADVVHFAANSLYSNGGLGADLGNDDVTRNDPFDRDSGPNGLQNFPELKSIKVNADRTTIRGLLNSQRPVSAFGDTHTIYLYISADCDESRHGEGRHLIAYEEVTADEEGRVRFELTLPFAVPSGQFLTATADQWERGTSEFSDCLAVR